MSLMRASTFFIINAVILIYLVLRIYWSAQKRSRPGTQQQKPFEIFDIFTNAASRPREKSLNCPFKFQGQTFDAYQVLGVPAGAPMEMCQKAFGQSDQSELYQAALNALKHQF